MAKRPTINLDTFHGNDEVILTDLDDGTPDRYELEVIKDREMTKPTRSHTYFTKAELAALRDAINGMIGER